MTTKRYPFKFLDSYGREDVSIFFGREEEIQSLYEMVFQSPVILVHGASGTGKTSLIQCGLATRFEEHEWLPLTVRRGSNINNSLKAILEKENSPEVGSGLEWLNEFAEPDTANTPQVEQRAVITILKSVCRNVFKPIYLIFDQFEELFIFGSKEEQNEFISTVSDILIANQPVKLIFSIREEYLGELFEFEKIVPQITKKKLRVEPMGLDKVRTFLQGITDREKNLTNVTLRKGEEAPIPERIFKIIKGESKERGIQLPYLQVFLDKLYLNITNDKSRQAEAEISMSEVDKIKDIGDVLRDLLEEQTRSIAVELSPIYLQLTTDMIWKILSPFVTLKGTKQPISKASLYRKLPDINPQLINEVIERFVNGRILRYLEGNDIYEISHDALGPPIAMKRSAEEIALLEIRRLIESQSSFKEDARLFNEKQISFMEPYLPKLKLSDDEQRLIDDSIISINKDKQKKRKQLVYTFAAIGAVMLILIILLIYAFQQKAINTRQAQNMKLMQAKTEALMKQQEQIESKTVWAQRRFQEDSSKNYYRLRHLTDSINHQIALSSERYNRFSNDVFVGKMTSVISQMRASIYQDYGMEKYFNLIDSTAGPQKQAYIAMLRDSIHKSKDLTFAVRALFFLHNATKDKAVLKEIMDMVSKRYTEINDPVITEIAYQTNYRYPYSEMYVQMRMQMFEQILDYKRKGLIKLDNLSYLQLLPTAQNYISTSTDIAVTKQIIIPASVLRYQHIEDYFDAIAISLEIINGGYRYDYQRAYGLQDLSDLNKLLFCCKMTSFLGSAGLSKSTRSQIVELLPDVNGNNSNISWEKFKEFNVPNTLDQSAWQQWATDHPDIMQLYTDDKLVEFKKTVTEYWNTHKMPY